MNNAILPQTLYQIIDKDILFIDIRIPEQFNQLHIKNFINIPYHKVFSYISNLPIIKPICLICYSGKQAEKLADQITKQGYQAYYIKGGFQSFLNLQNNQYF